MAGASAWARRSARFTAIRSSSVGQPQRPSHRRAPGVSWGRGASCQRTSGCTPCTRRPGAFSRVSTSLASAAPRAAWPGAWPKPSRSSTKQSGFARSWSSSAQRTLRRGGARPTARAVWPQRSSSWRGLRRSKPRQGPMAGSAWARMPPHWASTRPAPGPKSSLSSSANTRSALTLARVGAAARAAARVAGSMVKSRQEAKRSARKMRSASSSKRRAGSPTQRMNPAARSARPPKGSTTPPSSNAMALMVKSRRARSSLRSVTKRTRSGRRWSE